MVINQNVRRSSSVGKSNRPPSVLDADIPQVACRLKAANSDSPCASPTPPHPWALSTTPNFPRKFVAILLHGTAECNCKSQKIQSIWPQHHCNIERCSGVPLEAVRRSLVDLKVMPLEDGRAGRDPIAFQNDDNVAWTGPRHVQKSAAVNRLGQRVRADQTPSQVTQGFENVLGSQLLRYCYFRSIGTQRRPAPVLRPFPRTR